MALLNILLGILLKILPGAVIGAFSPTILMVIIGFARDGITRGTFAAWIHGMIGDVDEGHLFAWFQRRGAIGFSWKTHAIFAAIGSWFHLLVLVCVHELK